MRKGLLRDNGKIVDVAEAKAADIDRAVAAARFSTSIVAPSAASTKAPLIKSLVCMGMARRPSVPVRR
jgi:hypothetical protein